MEARTAAYERLVRESSSPSWPLPAAVFVVAASLAVSACGGSTSGPEGAHGAGGDAEGEFDEDGNPTTGEAGPERGPCSDGACFECGDTVCFPGFYCDEGGANGPGCSWLPACASTSSCSCLANQLTDCACEERDGHAFVRCE